MTNEVGRLVSDLEGEVSDLELFEDDFTEYVKYHDKLKDIVTKMTRKIHQCELARVALQYLKPDELHLLARQKELTDVAHCATYSFSSIYKATYRKNDVIVKNVLNIDLFQKIKWVKKEFLMIRTIPDHPHVLKPDAFVVDFSPLRRPSISEEKENALAPSDVAVIFPCHGTDLKKLILEGHVPETELLRIAVQMVKAVMHLHGHGIIHRDIALRNFLYKISDKTVKICDFGLSFKRNSEYAELFYPLLVHDQVEFRYTEELNSPSTIVAWQWTPMEVFDSVNSYGIESDIWSLGITLWELFCGGGEPFKQFKNRKALQSHFGEERDGREEKEEIVDNFESLLSPLVSGLQFRCSEDMKRIIIKCCAMSPLDRAPLDMILQDLFLLYDDYDESLDYVAEVDIPTVILDLIKSYVIVSSFDDIRALRGCRRSPRHPYADILPHNNSIYYCRDEM